jgi:16S rRNA (guanine(966)-N(2))-methyltransferase RsmD
LFNIIAPFIDNVKVLDLFSGSGSLAIEALSRGAQSAVLVDKNPQSVKIIQKNLERSGFTGEAKVLNMDYIDAVTGMVIFPGLTYWVFCYLMSFISPSIYFNSFYFFN